MAHAVDREETWDFILVEDRDLPAEERTPFTLRALDLRQERRVAQLTKGEEDAVGATEAGTFILKCGLVGWRNFKNSKGEEVEFQTGPDGKVTDRCLEMISLPNRTQLIKAIMLRSRVTEDQEKN